MSHHRTPDSRARTISSNHYGTLIFFAVAFGVVDYSTVPVTASLVESHIGLHVMGLAMGLIAAIPAVIAYNRHTHQTERLASRYDAFVDEFASILQRQAHTPGGAA